MLSERLEGLIRKEGPGIMKPLRLFPSVSEREWWEAIPSSRIWVELADGHLNGSWPPLKASLFRGFVTNGNRSRYEKIHFQRRQGLRDLLLGYLLHPDSRYLEEIIDLIWMICEESFWGIPAHNQVRGMEQPDLCDMDEPILDLFAAETGALIAWCCYLLKPVLEEASPLLLKRMKRELDRRVYEPFLERDDFWWMGRNTAPGQRLNNWTPWIISNLLTISLLLTFREEDRLRIISKSCRILDLFLEEYQPDGGCDEGPSYWERAGGSLFDCLELLYGSTGGRFSVYEEPLIKNIALYLRKMFIHDQYYVNFADSGALLPNIPGNLLYRYGVRIGDSGLQAFARSLWKRQLGGSLDEEVPESLLRKLYRISMDLGEESENTAVSEIPLHFWQENLEIMTAREVERTDEGFFIACKGGHNNENHNHNDAGNFIIYKDGRPLIIDAGVETYTAKTFGPDRYDIWTMRSAYHNLPLVNGCEQVAGASYKASGTTCSLDQDTAIFTTELKKAYPESAGINCWKRIIALSRIDGTVTVQDLFFLEHDRFSLHLLCRQKPVAIRDDLIEFEDSSVRLKVSEAMFIETEEILLEDERMKQSWFDRIYRLMMRPKKKKREGQILCLFQ